MKKITLAELQQTLSSRAFTLLDFSSPGCAPCQKIAQTLPALLAELSDYDIDAFEVDITVEAAIASKYFVLGVPMLILFKGEQEVARFNSLPKVDKIKRLLS